MCPQVSKKRDKPLSHYKVNILMRGGWSVVATIRELLLGLRVVLRRRHNDPHAALVSGTDNNGGVFGELVETATFDGTEIVPSVTSAAIAQYGGGGRTKESDVLTEKGIHPRERREIRRLERKSATIDVRG